MTCRAREIWFFYSYGLTPIPYWRAYGYIFAINYYFLLTTILIVETDMLVKCNNYYMNTETVNKKRGRPALGNVLFAKRVSPAKAAELAAICKEDRKVAKDMADGLRIGGGAYTEALKGAILPAMVADAKLALELAETRKNLIAMTDSYNEEYNLRKKLELDLEGANQDFEMAMAKTEEEKTRYWRDRAFRAEAAIKAKGGEYDQTQS